MPSERDILISIHPFRMLTDISWNALLYYLYTNKIVFCTPNSRAHGTSQIPECSAKSMYRLADKFHLEKLKSLALESLRFQLSANNIVREAFSTFTSLFPEIQDIEAEFLVKHLPNVAGIDEILRSVCDGGRPQCFDVLRKIVYRTEVPPAVPRPRRASLTGVQMAHSRSPSPAEAILTKPLSSLQQAVRRPMAKRK
ncbi:hypothetical protein K438DRAFT_1749607 [Mycena galopus ATCC 62051]|nr:hypothetical protein K438DRAFT_1749607 [Mycena galopus ATCC 62051]